jgi:tetratricopeptide (TPR) repeat protein
MAAKRWQESEVLQSQTLSRQRVVLGDTHPDTLSSLNNLQYAYFQQKRYADAFPIAEEVLHRRAEVSGKDHPNTIGAMHNVATIYEALGDLDKAEQVELSALTSNRRVLGDRHPSTLTTWEAYARILEKKGRKREALVELQAILETVGDQVDRPYPQIRERIQKRRMALSDAAGDASGRKR